MSKKVLPFISFIVVFLLIGSVVWLDLSKLGEDTILNKESILRLGGSTTIYSFAKAAAAAFMDANPDSIVIVSESSTGKGFERLFTDEVDIVNASRPIKPEERERAEKNGSTLHETFIGKDGVGVIIHQSKYQLINKLTKSQLKDIFFTGRIHKWSQLDSNLSGRINVYIRDPNESGTAVFFSKMITRSSDTSYVKDSIDVHITPLIAPALAEDPNGIAYTPLKWVTESVRVIAYGENEDRMLLPTKENISNGSYLLTRNLYMVTLEEPKRLAKSFIDFIISEKGEKIFNREFYLKSAK